MEESQVPQARCDITDMTETVGGHLELWRCDRDAGHSNRHHATQPDGSELWWHYKRTPVPDGLDPSRGLALGCVVGALVWAVIFVVAWFVLPGVW
jgi:hypothetical protein